MKDNQPFTSKRPSQRLFLWSCHLDATAGTFESCRDTDASIFQQCREQSTLANSITSHLFVLMSLDFLECLANTFNIRRWGLRSTRALLSFDASCLFELVHPAVNWFSSWSTSTCSSYIFIEPWCQISFQNWTFCCDVNFGWMLKRNYWRRKWFDRISI